MAFKLANPVIDDSKNNFKSESSGSILAGNKNLFNKKDFDEIKRLVEDIDRLIDSERDNQKELLEEINKLVEKERDLKLEKEKKLKELITNVTKKVSFINDDVNQKEMQLKNELEVLQKSIMLIHSNLSFGGVKNQEDEQPQSNAPSLVDKSELTSIKNTIDTLEEIIIEDKRKAKEAEKELTSLISSKYESIKDKELRVKKEVSRISQIISKINKQTAEKEGQLQKEIGLLQNSIGLIKNKLPEFDSSDESEEREEAPRGFLDMAEKSKSFFSKPEPKTKPRVEPELEDKPVIDLSDDDNEEESPKIEISFGDGDDDEEGFENQSKKDKKKTFGKGFYLFGKKE